MRNVYACLVHEQPACIRDLVRNLRAVDPASPILLYNGSQNPDLLADRPFFDRYGAVVHPAPQPMHWGRLHGFALDCMRFAAMHLPFDVLTIVDSDQLAVRPGYVDRIAEALAGRPDVGLLGNDPARQSPATTIPPARVAHREAGLWRPFLRRFPRGAEAFVHWTFWPSTVFTAAAAAALVEVFDTDAQLQALMQRTRIWATEEVLLPTLVALLGFQVARSPCSYEVVQYRTAYTVPRLRHALRQPDVFWVHPIPRDEHHALRAFIRTTLDDYAAADTAALPAPDAPLPDAAPEPPLDAEPGPDAMPAPPLLRTLPILDRMRRVEGWLEDDEADLLIAATAEVLRTLPPPHTLVEVGSYCGRSTVVLGSVVQALRARATVVAIDPHEGLVGAADQSLQTGAPTLDRFRRTIARNGLDDVVELIQACSFDVDWDRPISLLLIDGLHDYENVARDVRQFEAHVVPGGFIVFHDYAAYYPGVQRFVDELLAGGTFRRVACARSLMVVQRPVAPTPAGRDRPAEATPHPAHPAPPRVRTTAPPQADAAPEAPLVSCIMPTYDRRAFVPQAIRDFQRQTYPNRELLILDDGPDAIGDLVPDDPRIRYLRLPARLTLGAKRNRACEAARGTLIAHWDDDDWVAPTRLAVQVSHLMQTGAAVCGLREVLFYDPARQQAWAYRYEADARPWVYGATLCYARAAWVRTPFEPISVGEDTRFVWAQPPGAVTALEEAPFYVGRIHAANTSAKRTRGRRWHPLPPARIREILGADFEAFAQPTPGLMAAG
ncbi:hypothetical protein AWN76_014575 [Rhodothermaceae bacterium RA]|nr:hypothetical protein AWN76_014575 [Rhodothermaceae bacterium RA]